MLVAHSLILDRELNPLSRAINVGQGIKGGV